MTHETVMCPGNIIGVAASGHSAANFQLSTSNLQPLKPWTLDFGLETFVSVPGEYKTNQAAFWPAPFARPFPGRPAIK